MLNIKYDSNYKNVVNKIIEEINEKLKIYLIFDGDIKTALNKNILNIDYFEIIIKRDNPIAYEKPFHIFNYQDMLETIKIQNKETIPKYSIKARKPEKYLYIQLTIKEDTMNEYYNFNKYENIFAINFFNNNGLYVEKMNDSNRRYILVGMTKEYLEKNIDFEKIKFPKMDIDDNKFAKKILKNIFEKLENYNIYNNNELKYTKLGKLNISEDEDYEISKKTIDLFIYEHMVERLELAKWNKNYVDVEYDDKYLYTMLCINKELTENYDRISNLEKEIINKHLLAQGIYFKRIEKGKYTMIGINLNTID